MVETLYAMMEEDIFKKHKFARRSVQQYDEKTKLLTFKIFDTFNNAGEVKDELWNLLGKEKVLEEWGLQGLFLMTSNGEIFNAMEDERLLKVFKMPTLEEFLDSLMPSTAGVPSA
ncbi:hypothetical protein FOMA001_g15194 [Fusarium oxysporum f. sp. matthiolae]|nr:hypothetical protein FOMA001_g15194 [Fusarium oxysporum f. sp. matthiolae]